MTDRGRFNLLGVQINAVDYEAAVSRITAAATQRRPLAVSALAVHGVMTGVLDPAHRHRLNAFDLLVPDGQPVRWALNWLHHTGLTDRVYGPELTLAVCRQCAKGGLPVYFYGATPEMLERLRVRLLAMFPSLVIAGMEPSQFRRLSVDERDAVVARIGASGAAVTFVGLGCPRQEVWTYEMREALSMPVLAVGAAFAFHAGMLAQAPPWLQARGLEWAYRLVKEPTRLWKRYLLLNPLYVAAVLLQRSGIYRFEPHTAAPSEEVRYG